MDPMWVTESVLQRVRSDGRFVGVLITSNCPLFVFFWMANGESGMSKGELALTVTVTVIGVVAHRALLRVQSSRRRGVLCITPS